MEGYQESWNNVLNYCSLIVSTAENVKLEPSLLASLILLESGGDSGAISIDGAVGLMQIMPRDGVASKFLCPNGPCFANRPSSEELLDPAFNIKYGSEFLSDLIRKYGLRDGLYRYGPVGVGYEGYADRILEIISNMKQ